MRVIWTPELDAALETAARGATSVQDACVRFEAATGYPLKRDAADKRLARSKGTTLAELVARPVLEIPIEWCEEDEQTEPQIVAPAFGADVSAGSGADVPAGKGEVREVRSVEPQGQGVAEGTGLERILIIPDCHIPYEDGKAWATMMAAARTLKPTTIIILGDFLDMMACSGHPKGKGEVVVQLKAELEAGNARLDELETLGAKRRIMCEGNHEERGSRKAARDSLGLSDMLSTPNMLRLNERGWTFIPYRHHIKVGKIHFTHDTGIAGAYAHARGGAAFEASVCHGHTHRAAVSYFGSVTGETHVAAMMGWLGDRSACNYLPEVRKKDWQHGFGVAYVEPNQNTHLAFVPIIDGRCVVAGQLVSWDSPRPV